MIRLAIAALVLIALAGSAAAFKKFGAPQGPFVGTTVPLLVNDGVSLLADSVNPLLVQ